MAEKGESDRQLEYILKQLNLREKETNVDEESTGDGPNSPARAAHQVITSEETRSPDAGDGLVVESVGSALSTLKNPVRVEWHHIICHQ